MKDLKNHFNKKFRRSSPTRVKPRQSLSTVLIENHGHKEKQKGTKEIYPGDWNHSFSTFSPTSFTNILREKRNYPQTQKQRAGIDPYYPEPTFIKNQRLKGQTPQETGPSKKQLSPQAIKSASDDYWNTFSPASRQNIADQASLPTVLPAHVVKRQKPNKLDAVNPSSTTETPSKSNFTLPKKPNVKNDISGGEAAATTPSLGSGPKLGGGGSGLKLGGGGGSGLKLNLKK